MTEVGGREDLRKAAADEAANVGVFFQVSWLQRKTNIVWNLKEEVEVKKDQQPATFVEAVCGIVGQPHTGRKHLADRFGRMKEADIDEISNDQQLCYSCNFDTTYRGRPIQAVIKAYIIPPPYTEGDKEPLYKRAAPQFCCLLFAFDVTKPDSFDAAQDCIRNMKIALPPKYFMVGNKCDLRGTGEKIQEVPQKLAETQALTLGAACYFECSAKKNIKVKPIMEAIVKCECDRPHV